MMGSKRQLRLSLVLTGRNDNYGGDFRSRLQHCVTNAFEQLSKAEISSEILFVNYNPTDDNEPIERFIHWPKSTSQVSIRIISVPNFVHQKLVESGERKDVPVIEYLGKNAGIRRAKGEFILSMNPDIILTSELTHEIKQLNENSYYRANRVDFYWGIKGERQPTRVYMKGHDYPIKRVEEIAAIRSENACANRWKRFTPRIKGLLNLLSIPVYYNNIGNRFHCNVSGDFMLMHSNHWIALEGHHEHTRLALHVDALMVVQAACLGLKEVTMDSPIYHQEHERRYDASKANPEFETAYQYFEEQSSLMIGTQKAEKYNGPHWGLSKFDLPEMKL